MFKGNIIKEKREKLNMTQEALAIACGYKDKSIICRIEKGQSIDIPLSKALKLADTLDLDLLEIVNG